MHGNAEIVRRAYAAFSAADIPTPMETPDEPSSWMTRAVPIRYSAPPPDGAGC